MALLRRHPKLHRHLSPPNLPVDHDHARAGVAAVRHAHDDVCCALSSLEGEHDDEDGGSDPWGMHGDQTLAFWCCQLYYAGPLGGTPSMRLDVANRSNLPISWAEYLVGAVLGGL